MLSRTVVQVLFFYLLVYASALIAANVWPDTMRLVGVNDHYYIRDLSTALTTLAAVAAGLVCSMPLFLFFPVVRSARRKKAKQLNSSSQQNAFAIGPFAGYACIAIAFMLLVAELARTGVMNFLSRDDYIAEHTDTSALSAIGILIIIVPTLCAIANKALRGSWLRSLSLFAMLLYCLMQLGTASRKLAVGIATYAIVNAVLDSKYRRPTRVAIAGFLFLLSYNFALNARGLPEHGLLNYLKTADQVFLAMIDFEPFITTLSDNLTVLDATLLSYQPTDFADFIVAVNPLPGGMAGWPAIAETQRLSKWTPFCAIGEIGAHGLLFTWFFFLALGCMLTVVEHILSKFSQRSAIPLLVYRACILVFAIYSVQYNLRSSVRFLYYAVALSTAATLGMLLSSRKQPTKA